jgi:hypothetical protein
MARPETVYTSHVLYKIEERRVLTGWIERTLTQPDWTEPDVNDPAALRAFKAIPERDMRVLRVVYVDEGPVRRVITAFFDRGARRRKP